MAEQHPDDLVADQADDLLDSLDTGDDDEEDAGAVMMPRPIQATADLDITPMIDITFLLLIFFIVASTTDVQSSVELPPARYGDGVSDRTSVVLTIAEPEGAAKARVYLDDGMQGTPLPDDPAAQKDMIAQYVREGFNSGKETVLVKAGRGVRHREVSRVVAAAGEVEGVDMHLAVLEIE
jgi:biopolymer transport protein ExbD